MESNLKTVGPTTTTSEIKPKINELKATRLAEYKKLRACIQGQTKMRSITPICDTTEDNFILDHVEPRRSFDDLDLLTVEICVDKEQSRNAIENSSRLQLTTSICTNASAPRRKRKRAKKEANESIREEATNVLKELNRDLQNKMNVGLVAQRNDEYQAYAMYIISKLKQINNENIQLEVEENIIKCIFDGIKKCKM